MTPAQEEAPSGRATERGNAASPAEVGAMFDGIARVYDPMNLVISAFQEPRWRKRAVKLAGVRPGDRLLDVATGTGKVAADLWTARPARRRRPRGRHLAGHDPRRQAPLRRPGGARLRRRRRARAADRGRHASMPRRSRSGCATCPTTARASPRWPAPCGRAARSSASRSPGRAAGRRGSSSSGSTGSCRSSAASRGRAARTATSSAASRAIRGRTGSPRSCARPASRTSPGSRCRGGIVTLHTGTVPPR